MHLALALCLAASLAADAPAADNLDFHTGTLDGWEGESFAIAPVGQARRLASLFPNPRMVLRATREDSTDFSLAKRLALP
jgi:hypothetical protein